jgi:hypothetical protein
LRGRQAIEMTGQRIGKLLVLGRAGMNGQGHMQWHVRCQCGVERAVSGSDMRRGRRVSCGCGIRTHNLSRSRTYKSWGMMRQRCNNPDNYNYPRYGAKGIRVCASWERFENFLADMGERPPGTSLDRIDSAGHYEPSNCRWATREQQNVNTTRWAGYSTIDGERISVRAIADILAISEPSIAWALKQARRHLAR